ncbi:S8 family serine peptidase [Microbacteriaceae bacterium 4G12]
MKRKLTAAAVTSALAFTMFGTSGLSAKAETSSAPQQTQEKTYLMVFVKGIPANYESIVEKAGGKVSRVISKVGALEAKSSNPQFAKKMKMSGGVQAINEEFVHKLNYKKIDPKAADGKPVTDIPQPENTNSYWNYQWDIQNVTNNGESYKIQTGGQKNADGTVTHKAVVGVIDSGIDPNHPDLKANYLGGKNFVPAGADATEKGDPKDVIDRGGHGTHVSGSIAANGKLKGVGPDLGIRTYRVFPESGSAPTAWIVDAILQAVEDKVDVINMSIGGFSALTYSIDGKRSSDVADVAIWMRAMQYAAANNVTVVTAAGNESLNYDDKQSLADYFTKELDIPGLVVDGPVVETPGGVSQAITVSSSNKWSKDKLAFYSNYGQNFIEVAAPGGDNGPVYAETGDLSKRDFHYRALSTWPTYLAPYFTSNLHDYALMHGTSMAAPKVAGIAGVIKAQYPSYSAKQVRKLIEKTAKDYGTPGFDNLYGYGEANVYNALTVK